MKVIITPHAVEQIRNRKLTSEHVSGVASAPEQIVPATGRRFFAQSKYMEGGKQYLLRVLCEDQDGERYVITIYPTSKVKKYWKESDP